jgi:hypothetical protein
MKRSVAIDDVEPPEIERFDSTRALRDAIQKGIDAIAAGDFTTIRNEDELRAFFDDL